MVLLVREEFRALMVPLVPQDSLEFQGPLVKLEQQEHAVYQENLLA